MKCPECNGDVVLHNGEYVCSKCGLVVDQEFLSPIIEFHTNDIDSPAVSKQYASLGERHHIVDGIGSYIDYYESYVFKDSRGTVLNKDKQSLFRRLKFLYDSKYKIFRNETPYRALRTLNHACANLQVPVHIRDRAAYYYHKLLTLAKTAKLSLTNHILAVAACLVIALHEGHGSPPITIREVIEVFRKMGHRVNHRNLMKKVFELKKLLRVRYTAKNCEDFVPRIVSKMLSSKDVKRILNKLRIDVLWFKNALEKETYELLKMVPKKERGGRHPYTLATAAVYAASRVIAKKLGRKNLLTQKIVAKAAGVREYGLRDHFCAIFRRFCEQ
ncbi:MAG: TFIIB-type zinc ribbon-containing protein [Candidatus Baldrarchaeia archaeon]